MRIIIAYLIGLLIILGLFLLYITGYGLPDWFTNFKVFIVCLIFGGIGGCVYLLKSVYKHRCALNDWDDSWATWYYVRPIISIVCGGISYIFLKAGLLFLDASINNNSNEYGFIALAFIAGFNVDNFLKWLERIVKGVWGIESSNLSKTYRSNNEDNRNDD